MNLSLQLVDKFIHHAISQGSPRRNRELAFLSPRQFLETPDSQRDIVWLGHLAHRSPSYQLDRNVLDAVTKLQSQTLGGDEVKSEKFMNTMSQHPEIYTPPFPVMYVEWPHIPGSTQQTGFLIERLPNNKPGIKCTFIHYNDKQGVVPSTTNGILTFTCEGALEGKAFKNGVPVTFSDPGAIGRMTAHAMYLMMLLKSRTPLLKLVEADTQTPPLNIVKRISRGRPTAKSIGLLTFDITRTMAKGRAANEEEARRFVAEQIVIGHFKLREVRNRNSEGQKIEGTTHELVWWDSHYRGGTPEDKLARKDQPVLKQRLAQALMSDPGRPLTGPGYGIFPDELTIPERSRILPEASIKPGFSEPFSPYRTRRIGNLTLQHDQLFIA